MYKDSASSMINVGLQTAQATASEYQDIAKSTIETAGNGIPDEIKNQASAAVAATGKAGQAAADAQTKKATDALKAATDGIPDVSKEIPKDVSSLLGGMDDDTEVRKTRNVLFLQTSLLLVSCSLFIYQLCADSAKTRGYLCFAIIFGAIAYNLQMLYTSTKP